MKTRVMILGTLVCLLVLIFLGGCGPTKYTPKANEEIYGTWINEQTRVTSSVSFQKVIYSAKSTKEYHRLSDSDAAIEDKLEITGKWKDSEGNTWYKGITTITGGTLGDIGAVNTWLIKLSKAATVMERVNRAPSSDQERKNPVYPTAVDVKGDYYSIFHRQGG